MRERLSELSEALWREREALELILFKLEEQRLLLLEGQCRWLCHASRELDAVLDQLSEIELCRAVAATAAAGELDVPEDSHLRALSSVAPAPWPSVIGRHIGALRRLAEQILELAARNRVLLQAGLADVRKTVAPGPKRPSTRTLVDVAAYHAALATNDRLLHPSLVDTVRR